MLKKIIKKIVYFFFPLKNVILFESAPDYSDNTRAVFDEMLRRGLNKKYKLIWFSKTVKEFNEKNVISVTPQNKFKRKYYNIVAKLKICCNGFLLPQRKGQHAFYLGHGATVKSVRNYYTIPAQIDYCLIMAESMVDLTAYELNFDKNKIVPLGYPRNDALTNVKLDIKKMLNTTCDKVAVWYPTFRQHKNGMTTESVNALPIIHDIEKAVKLNECAAKNNVLIVLKPHFAQDVSYVKDLNLSNIRFIDDSFFTVNGITSYEFVGNTDALITDYSSIYYDYTLCDKPIAAIWEDIEEYKKNPGLANGYEELFIGAEKVYTLDDFTAFIDRLAQGVDLLNKERNEIKLLTNYACDGKNSERVVDFILEKFLK